MATPSDDERKEEADAAAKTAADEKAEREGRLTVATPTEQDEQRGRQKEAMTDAEIDKIILRHWSIEDAMAGKKPTFETLRAMIREALKSELWRPYREGRTNELPKEAPDG